jgi:glutamyl-tRNA reductase
MILCFSVSHKNTSLLLLETLVIKGEDEFAKAICFGETQECIMLQTCHRVEIYCALKIGVKSELIKRVIKLWSTETGVSNDIIAKVVSVFEEKEALKHLFFVVSGLESVVIGEDQILGQVRDAYLRAKERKTVGLIFDKVFTKALNTGRKVRNETKIDEGSMSISSAAVSLATREFEDLSSVKSLVIGAGEAGVLAAKALKSHGALSITIADRTYERGFSLAEEVSGNAVNLVDLKGTLPKIDLVIGAVSVTHPILDEQDLLIGLKKRTSPKKMVFIDISQPRCFDEKIGSLPGICLKNIDDLKNVLAETTRNRQIEAEKSKNIIFAELVRLENELSMILAQPLIVEICRRYEEIRQKELKRAVGKLGESDKEKLRIIERFSRELVERIAQIPIEKLKKAALSSDGELLSAAEELFDVEG